jgi:hypothetical protein
MSYSPVADSRYCPAKPIAEPASDPVAVARVTPNASMVRVPETVEPVVVIAAVMFADGSLRSQELTPPELSASAAPVVEVGSVSHAVVREPVWSYSPARTGRLDRSSHDHVASVTPPTVREVRLPFVSFV